MYVPAWALPGNGYMTHTRGKQQWDCWQLGNGSVTTDISTATIDHAINKYPSTAGWSASYTIKLGTLLCWKNTNNNVNNLYNTHIWAERKANWPGDIMSVFFLRFLSHFFVFVRTEFWISNFAFGYQSKTRVYSSLQKFVWAKFYNVSFYNARNIFVYDIIGTWIGGRSSIHSRNSTIRASL
jgi:hypothetical protein